MYFIQHHKSLPALTYGPRNGYNPDQDLLNLIADLRTELDQVEEPVYLVSDTRDYHTSIQNLIRTASTVIRDKNPLLKHPNVRSVILVTTNKVEQMAARGLNTEAFGFLSVLVFDDLDAAYRYIGKAEGFATF